MDKTDVEWLYLYDNSDDQLKWDSFMHFITNDSTRNLSNDVAVAESQFTQYVDGNL